MILGEPGSGKTTVMLTLANHLINQAEADTEAPIPVVLNLSSWAEESKPLEKWIVDELGKKYGFGKRGKQTKKWLRKHHLVLLLDGLNEVAQKQQKLA